MVIQAKKIISIPLKPWDYENECFSWITFYHGSNGHVYYNYSHSDWSYCPLKNIPNEYCPYDLQCSNCSEAKDFVLLDNQKLPVKRLT